MGSVGRSAMNEAGALARERHVWLRHIGLYGLTVWIVLTLNFLLPRLMPGDPILALLDPQSSRFVSDSATRARLTAYYGLDKPLVEQYVRYVTGIVTGNLGWSIRLKKPVSELIATRLPWTLLLTIPSLLLASGIAIVAGAHSGWVRGSRIDHSLLLAFTGLEILPVYFVGILALLLFSVYWGVTPLAGATTPFREWATPWEQAADILHHWALPAALLTLEMLGGRFLLMRNSMVGVLGEDFILVARAKGLRESNIKYRHGVRNAILPFFTVFAVQLGFVVTGAIFIETLFAYPGMGNLMFDSVRVRDYPVLEGVFLVVALSVLTMNLVSDLMYGRLDPRVQE